MFKKNQYQLDSSHYYSLILMRPNGKENKQIRIKSSWFWSLLTLLGVLSIALLFGSFNMVKKSAMVNEYKQLKLAKLAHQKQLDSYNRDIQAIRDLLVDVIAQEEEIDNFIKGTKKRKRRRKSTSKKKSKNAKAFSKGFIKVSRADYSYEKVLDAQLDYIKDELVLTQTRLNKRKRELDKYKARFEATPTLWPVYGRVLSRYGWRVHPKTGRMQFHKGVDIPSWIGAPVKATAEGIVEFSGWGGGYGWLIIIGHRYGYRTMYAHLSDRLVFRGQTVGKGEIIGKIGESGITTGPHIHYEIRRWRRSISPHQYLGMDLFTAASKVW